ncbi:MAG: hypothetical protein ACYC5O_08540 [Anaerolineae bacterium]
MTGSPHGRFWSLRVQILLWTIAPAIILAIAFMLAGVGEHRRAMRSMVAERDSGLAQALAAGSALRSQVSVALPAALHRAAMASIEGRAIWRVPP